MPSILVNGASVIQYAGDTTLYFSETRIEDLCNELAVNLCKIKTWLDANYLSLNITKTYFTIFTNKAIPQNIFINLNGQNIDYSPNPTFLGITLDQKLTFDKHINHVKGKVSRSKLVIYLKLF